MSGSWPLVGRRRELADLEHRLAAAAAGSGGLVLLGGEAGVGKTALIRAAVRAPHPRPAHGGCAGPGETPPYGPWCAAVADVQALRAGLDPGPLPPPLGTAAGEWQPADAAGALAAWLGAAAEPGRCLPVILEDLQWADPASLAVLRHLPARLGRVPVLVMATYRSDELDSTHPLWTLLPDLQRAGAHRLLLERLTEPDVAELAAAALPDLADPVGAAADLYRRTSGHPLFVTELLAASARTGAAPDTGGPLPETVQQAIDRRVGRLAPAAQTVLEAAAVIGDPLRYSLLARTTAMPEIELTAALQAAMALRIVRSAGPGGDALAFDHALVREAVLARLFGPARQRWHSRVADALLAEPAAEPDPVAWHLDRAGDPRAADYLAAAGDRALQLGAPDQAAARYERALALRRHPLQAIPEPAPETGALLLKLGYALRLSDLDRACRCWEEAVASGDRAAAVWSRHLLAMALYWRADPRCAAALAAVEQLQEELLEDDRYRRLEAGLFGSPCGYPRAGPSRALALARDGQPDAARVLLDRLHARVPPGSRRSELLAAEFWLAFHSGRLAEALELGRQVTEDALRAGNYRQAVQVEGNRLYIALLCNADQPDQVDAVAAHLTELLAEMGRRWGSSPADTGFPPLGWYSFLRGDRAAARHHLLGYLQHHPADDDPGVRGFAVLLQLADGDPASARATLAAVPPHQPDAEPPLHTVQVAAYTLRAQLCLAEGELDQARAWLEAADRFIARTPAAPLRAAVRLGWATLLRQAGDPAGALDQAAQGLALAEAGREFRFIIMAHQLLGEAAADLGRTAAAAAHLRAALELARRCRFPYYAGLAEQALARIAPEPRPAAGAAPGPRPVPAGVPPLTSREVDVVRLVAQGLTDKEVAARLFISPRTVDNHLRRIFGKLEVGTRAALAAYAARHGLAE